MDLCQHTFSLFMLYDDSFIHFIRLHSGSFWYIYNLHTENHDIIIIIYRCFHPHLFGLLWWGFYLLVVLVVPKKNNHLGPGNSLTTFFGMVQKITLSEGFRDLQRLGITLVSGYFCVTDDISGHWPRILGEEKTWELFGSVSHLHLGLRKKRFF